MESGAAMPTELHDTSAVSCLLLQRTDREVKPYFAVPHVPAVSFQTVGELLVWAKSPTIVPSGPSQIRQFIESTIVLEGTSEIAEIHAEIIRRWKAEGRRERIEDAWIGATALAHGLPLITYDQRDFLSLVDLGLDLRILRR